MQPAPCTLVVGLSYGDEGKGATIDSLTRQARRQGWDQPALIVRFNGGPQAAHHVVTPAGQRHCFAQFGAGTLVAGTRTLLSQSMLIEPLAILREAQALADLGVVRPLRQLTIDRRCIVVTPFHKIVNRMQELARRDDRHGSCGLGVGQAWLDSQRRGVPTLRIGDADDPARLRAALRFLQLCKVDLAEQIVDAHPDLPALRSLLDDLRARDWVDGLSAAYADLLAGVDGLDDGTRLRAALTDPLQPVLFEGAQGVLLDAVHGFFPYVTPSRTTFRNALSLIDQAGANARPIARLGVLRAYATRHGPGPFVTEDATLAEQLPEAHNGHNAWQGTMRVGWFDAVAARYALSVLGDIDGVVLTHTDRLAGLPCVRVATHHQSARAPAPLRDLGRQDEPPIDALMGAEWQAAQRQRTIDLQAHRPVYVDLPGWPARAAHDDLPAALQAFVDRLQHELGAPIVRLAYGPCGDDQRPLAKSPSVTTLAGG